MGELVKISDITAGLGISSRTLRYYEETGLIQSVRPQFEAYRYYDEENVERIREICVLRKMQIPIRDVIRIFESRDMSVVVETFVKSLDDIEFKISSLTELKSITNEFLQTMLQMGVRHISALPLIYERIGREFADEGDGGTVTYAQLEQLSAEISAPCDPEIIVLPFMRVWSSVRRDSGRSDPEGFLEWLESCGLLSGFPERHTQFEYQTADGEPVMIRRQEDGAGIPGPFTETVLEGGMFAVGSVYADEDMEAYYLRLLKCMDENPYYEPDYLHNGGMRCPVLAESVMSADRHRDRINLFLPVKKRLPDASLYGPCRVLEGITAAEVLESVKAVWQKDIRMDGLKPIMQPYYRVNEQGEAEYIPYIGARRLSTETEVRLPFCVDVEFRMDSTSAQYAWGADEGSLRIYHGGQMYGINMENSAPGSSQEAILFQQPVFGDEYMIPKRGKIEPDRYNRLTWIVGEQMLAVIINDEVRYCGTDFPYMKTDFREIPAATVVIGGNGQGKICLKSICVSQLRQSVKRLMNGDFRISIRRSNNVLDNIHPLITMHYGENYWFNGCARYVMEAKGEPDYDYDFFAGLTGDNFVQVYPYRQFRGNGRTGYLLTDGNKGAIEEIFHACGYGATCVTGEELKKNSDVYVQTLMAYIDSGVPVIWGKNDYPEWSVIVGYEEHGNVLLYLTEEKQEPERVSLKEAAGGCAVSNSLPPRNVWIFVGEKYQKTDLARICRKAVQNLADLLITETDEYCFGHKAFLTWADDVEKGRYAGLKPEEFDDWAMHKSYVCNLSTNASCCHTFLERTRKLNPDMEFLKAVGEQYGAMGVLWGELEKLGGGFNISLETLQDKDKSAAIAAKLREFAACEKTAAEILSEAFTP